MGNETADKCAKSAAELPNRGRYAFTSLAYAKRQIQQKGLTEWKHLWETIGKGQEYCSIAQKQPLWGPSWKPTKLLNTDQTTASTTHQLRLGHGYFRALLARLPSYNSTQCQCSERVQSVDYLLLGCRTYQSEREAVGITRETTLHSLLFTPKGTTMLQNLIKSTKVATRGWLLQGGNGSDRDDRWGWGRSGESTAGEREAEQG